VRGGVQRLARPVDQRIEPLSIGSGSSVSATVGLLDFGSRYIPALMVKSL